MRGQKRRGLDQRARSSRVEYRGGGGRGYTLLRGQGQPGRSWERSEHTAKHNRVQASSGHGGGYRRPRGALPSSVQGAAWRCEGPNLACTAYELKGANQERAERREEKQEAELLLLH